MHRQPPSEALEPFGFQLSLLRLVATAHDERAGSEESPDRQLELLVESARQPPRAA